MSYNPSQHGPRGPPPQQYGIPTYPEQATHRPQQRPAQPAPQGRRAPQQGYGHDPRMRFPHPQAFPGRAPPPHQTQNLYDGSDYGEEDAGQWPLNAPGMAQNSAPPMPQQPVQRGPPPRPRRPDSMPDDYDPSRQPPRVAPANRQYHQPPPQQSQPHHGSGEWTGDGYAMPGAPPNALPQVQNQALPPQANNQARRPPLGPPPSARRGPSSYYSHMSPVHPIVEESDSARGSIRNPSRGSYASSNAIPIGIPDYYLDHRDSGAPSLPSTTPGSEYPPDEYSPVQPVPPLRYGAGVPREQSRQEQYQPQGQEYFSQSEAPTLVRQASLGKRSKPTLTTVKSGDRLRSKSSANKPEGLAGLPSQHDHAVPNVESPEEIPMVFQTPRTDYSEKDVEAGAPPTYAASHDAPTGNVPASGFYDSSSEKSSASHGNSNSSVRRVPSREMLAAAALQGSQARGRSPLDEAREKEILGNLERGGAIEYDDDGSDTLKPPTAGFASNRAGGRRPPRLNVDSVRDAEARGSLTSLPDLIKRATRLASNLDRGRTASRLGMNEWLGIDKNGSKGDLAEQKDTNYRKSSGSISDILNSFPPPGVPTPPGSRQQRRSWLGGSNLRHSALASDSDAGSTARRTGREKKRGRRCCGMPLWLFLLLLALLVCLVAAAIVVPVVLVVIPKQNESSNTSSASVSSAALEQCSAKLTCQNSGQVVAARDHSCRCVCVNGFTGKTCETKSEQGCASMSLAGMTDATIGDALPRLLDAADSNYSIPLDGEILAGLFSTADLSCAGENALVTFSGKAQKRQTPTQTSASGAAVTSNGIVFESGAPSSATSSATPTSSPQASSNSSTGHTPDSRTLDFARVAVLYLFQTSGQLGTATTAQGKFQQYFDTGTTPTGQNIAADDVELGGDWSANLEALTLTTGNGTTVGGS